MFLENKLPLQDMLVTMNIPIFLVMKSLIGVRIGLGMVISLRIGVGGV